MKIIVTGGTGFIGRALVDELARLGHEVVVLTRKADRYSRPSVRFVEWDARSLGPWQAEFLSADAVVNLAGEPIAEGRWTESRKRVLLTSRILATRLVVAALAGRSTALPVLISASGIGYYGASDDRLLDEGSPLGQGFLADLSAAWEDGGAARRSVRDACCAAENRHGARTGRWGLAKDVATVSPLCRWAGVTWHAVGLLDPPDGSYRIDQLGHHDADGLGSCECGGSRVGHDEDLLCDCRKGPPSSVVVSCSWSGVTPGAG